MQGGWGHTKGRVFVCERMCCSSFAGRLNVFSQSGYVQWIVFKFEGNRGVEGAEMDVNGDS